jgi:hypothetical protein
MHLACTYDDANAVLRSKSLGRIWRDREPDDVWNTFNWLHSDSILESEPPKHTRLRALVAKAFLRGQIERMRPAVERIADELLDAAIEKQGRTGPTSSRTTRSPPGGDHRLLLGVPSTVG